MKVIIYFFDKFPLKTKKRADFILFKSAVELVIRKEHLTEEGFLKILVIKASMNKGLLSDSWKDKFPDIVAVERPKVEIPIKIDPNWMAGFTSGDGCFYVRVSKNSKYNTGFLVELKF